MSETNRYLNGKKRGHWVEQNADGNVAEGPYVEGRRHGHWIERYPEGVTAEGPSRPIMAKPQEPFQQAAIPPVLLNQNSTTNSSDAGACIKRGRMAPTR